MEHHTDPNTAPSEPAPRASARWYSVAPGTHCAKASAQKPGSQARALDERRRRPWKGGGRQGWPKGFAEGGEHVFFVGGKGGKGGKGGREEGRKGREGKGREGRKGREGGQSVVKTRVFGAR